ncbi:MAG: hypothetical protein ACE5ET_11555 [Gammaproteobacteria bacterium]
MRAFASYILRGRMQAILVAAVAAVLALLLPLLSHVSGTVIALVTLRRSYREGLLVMAGAGLLLGMFGYISTVSFPLVSAFLVSIFLVIWLPVLVTAEVLRNSRDLGRALTVTGLLAVVAMVILQLAVGDTVAWWRTLLDAVLAPMLEEAPVPLSAADKARMLDSLAGVMSGFMAAAVVYSTAINLFLGRWLQAILFNPGGFRQEFHQLRLGRGPALASLMVLVLITFASGGVADFAGNLLILVVVLYAFHGLALVHGVVAATGAHKAWLVALYLLMLFLLPQVMVVLSAAGFADSWVNFRSRLKKPQ